MCNNYPYHSIYNNLIDKGFRILEPYLLTNFDDIVHHEKYGDYQNDLRTLINNYFYELYRLAEWLEYLNNHLKTCNKTCLTDDEITKSKTKFLIDCPLICSNPRSREIIKLFEDAIPRCGVSNYSWYNITSCYRGDLIYSKIKTVIDGVESILLIPPNATIEDIKNQGVPDPYATNLFNTRVVEIDSVNCCQYETINPPYLDIINITTNTVTLSYVLQNNQASGVISLNGQSINITEPSGTLSFTGLTLSTDYVITFTVTNCAGSFTINRNFSTLPYFLTIVLGPNITGNLNFGNSLVVGVNQFNFYCTQVNVTWTGVNNIHEVTEFLVNGENRISDITWNQVSNGKNIGGTFTIPCIDRDYTIYIEGIKALDCSDIDATINGNTITISL